MGRVRLLRYMEVVVQVEVKNRVAHDSMRQGILIGYDSIR